MRYWVLARACAPSCTKEEATQLAHHSWVVLSVGGTGLAVGAVPQATCRACDSAPVAGSSPPPHMLANATSSSIHSSAWAPLALGQGAPLPQTIRLTTSYNLSGCLFY
jgi:hypothetical protein